MRVRVNIAEGVSRGICGTCMSAQIIVDDSGHETVFCHQFMDKPFSVPRPVLTCSRHISRTDMTLHEAKDLGWVLNVRGGRVIGFEPPTREKPWTRG